MKTKLLTSALLLALTLNGFAQDKNSLKIATQKMIDLTNQENYGDLVGTVYPAVFDVVPKDDYVNQQEKTINGPDYKIHMIRIEPSIDYGAVKKADLTTYCLVNYDQMLTVELLNKLAPQEVADKEAFFKKLLGTEEVYYMEQTNTIDIKRRVQRIAMADESTYQQWTFVDPKIPGIEAILKEPILQEIDPEKYPSEAPVDVTNQSQQNQTQTKYTEAKKAEEAKKKSVQKKS